MYAVCFGREFQKYTQLYPDPYDCTCRLQLSIGSQYPRQPHTGTDSIRSLVVLSPASGMVHGADRTVSGSFCTVYLYAAIGIVLPFISAYVTIKWFAPYFAAHLNPANEAPVKTARAGKEKTARFLAALFTRSAMQKSGFMLSWRLAAGNRKYKEAILPSIAYIIVLIGLQIFSIWKKEILMSATLWVFSHFILLY